MSLTSLDSFYKDEMLIGGAEMFIGYMRVFDFK